MSTVNNSSHESDNTFASSEISLPRPIRFWLMLLFNIPSIICSFCLILHIIIDRIQRYALQNHTILLILVFGLPIQLMDINFYLVFFRYGSVQPSKPFICLLWWLADYGFYIGGIILMAWLAIERHILIFHNRLVGNQRGRFYFHYLPLIIILTYIFLFYSIVIFFLPCQNTYDYLVPVCGASPCYQTYGILCMWEFIVNTTTPIFLEGIGSISLVVRVQWQKQRLNKSTQWRKQRRMTIQLCLISSLNLILNLPIYLIPLAHLCGLPSEYGIQAELYFFFLGYFVIFLFPFASLCQFPKLRKIIIMKILNVISKRSRHTAVVAPIMKDMQMDRLA
ncbi:unnamed protein product [Adineta steineri]|uniref:G-protein coupled receptors family 1 profile domain-containing protein n=1 Tax=Adineta steineri TaxID=433720 RepID=A0A819JLR5_9BILA|nr:unnamed protein product [Adineta steineri]CAF3935327.1 unnamed protein product [Adineta steineri]